MLQELSGPSFDQTGPCDSCGQMFQGLAQVSGVLSSESVSSTYSSTNTLGNYKAADGVTCTFISSIDNFEALSACQTRIGDVGELVRVVV